MLAKALRMSGLASKILTRSMAVWILGKLATWEGGGRLLAAEEWRSENKKRRRRGQVWVVILETLPWLRDRDGVRRWCS